MSLKNMIETRRQNSKYAHNDDKYYAGGFKATKVKVCESNDHKKSD